MRDSATFRYAPYPGWVAPRSRARRLLGKTAKVVLTLAAMIVIPALFVGALDLILWVIMTIGERTYIPY